MKNSKPFNYLLGVIGFLFLVSLSVTVTLNFRPLYYLDMELLNIPENSGYSAELVRENYDRLITYNNITFHGSLEFEQMPMSESARIHFEEVKQVFAVFEYMAIAAGLLYLVGCVVQWRKKDFGWLKTTAYCSIGIPLVLGVFVVSDWENVFVQFHELVFNNDYWLFDPSTDPVITILPDAYFMHCAVMIIGLVVAVSAGMLLVAHRKMHCS